MLSSLSVFIFVSIFSRGATIPVTETLNAISPATVQQLDLLESSIDYSVEPCDDFYHYACGNLENHEFAFDYKTNNDILEEKYLRAIEEMIQLQFPDPEILKTKENQSFREKVGAFYWTCKNYRIYNPFGDIKPDLDIEWPLISEFMGKPEVEMTNFHVLTSLSTFLQYGFREMLLNFELKKLKNGSVYIELEVPMVEESLNLYIKLTLQMIGFDEKNYPQQFSKYYEEIKNTHREWYNIFVHFKEHNLELFEYSYVKQLYPYLTELLEKISPNELRDNDIVGFLNRSYIDYLLSLEWRPQEVRRLYNYFMVLLYKNFRNELLGSCVNQVKSRLHFAVNYMYRQLYYREETKSALMELKDMIFKYIMEIVNENRLQFNEDQMKAVRDKLKRTYFNVGNVPDNADDSMLEEFYKTLPDMDVYSFSRNTLVCMKHKLWSHINCPAHMECIAEIGHGTYNIPEDDIIIISMASLKPYLYDHTYDPLLAQSLMGFLIGHEYGHSIDTYSLRNSYIFERDYKDFQNQPHINSSIECMRKQFDIIINERQLQVDLLGARAAFRAYRSEHNVDRGFIKRPWHQVFFINFAQYFCQWETMYEGVFEHKTRTNYVAMNMQEFAEAFNCPADSKMNPMRKCLLY